MWLLASILPLLVGLAMALRAAWVCDDAFITFRYADNFDGGLGLVYNAGERVEGYTHFLWAIVLAALHRSGLDLVELGRYASIAFYAAMLVVLLGRSWRRSAVGPFLPIAAWGVALHPDLQIWASGGLETAAFALCVTLAALAVSSETLRPGAIATAAALAALFRPEGLLVTASAAAILVWRGVDARSLARFAGVWLALVLPLFVWRFLYYHDWLPNTYYAKSAGVANWEQGWRYVRLYFAVYPFLILAVVSPLGVLGRGRRDSAAAVLSCLGIAFVMLLYVLRVGGDFMFARFLVPITPLLYVALEEMSRCWRPRSRIAFALLVVAATVVSHPLRDRVLAGAVGLQGIVDEHVYYPRRIIDERRRQGEEMASIFRGLEPRVCILGAQAGFGYFAGFPYIFERYGLTDREFARRPVEQRGRPGHERGLSRRDLMARRVHFLFIGAAKDRSGALDEAVLGSMLASIVHYDRAFMDSLRGRPGVEFVDYPAHLDSVIERAARMSPESKRSAWAFAQGYYFDHNVDPERFVRARAALVAAARDE